MKTYTLKSSQNLPVSLASAWDFFSSPLNLAKITPPKMRFRILSDFKSGQKIYPGMIITYNVSPIFKIKLNWMTEITQVKEYEHFTDDQRSGPFALWHHQHHFKEIPGGVNMVDTVNYALPYAFIGRIAHSISVKKELEIMFKYRKAKIEELFGNYDLAKL
jgi:ligand-binding SRPBCC domain-containing protein